MREKTIMKGELKKTIMKLGTAVDKYSLKMSVLFQAYLSWNTYSNRPINPKNLCFSQSHISIGTRDLRILVHLTLEHQSIQ